MRSAPSVRFCDKTLFLSTAFLRVKQEKGMSRLRPVSVGRQRDLHEVLPKVRPTSLHLERRTGVLACFQLQPLRTRTPFDAQPRSSTRVCVASELCRRLVIARTCNGSDFHSTSSGTELLLRSQHRTSSVHNLRKSKITIKVPVGILVLDVMPATLVAPRPLPKQQVVLSLQRPALACLMMNAFENINASKSASGDGFPTVALCSVGRWKALLGFDERRTTRWPTGSQETTTMS
ncbi:hypothetical protein MRX96_006024 [Rhipicephalus microplus]